MRTNISLLALAAVLLWTLPAHADNLFFKPDAPIETGQTLKGLVRMNNGGTALADVYVEGTYQDDLFNYWVGSYGGKEYYYDKYSTYWMPGPVSYQHATLDFQGETQDGWVRIFGGGGGVVYPDYNHFFGNDGVLYNRITISRNRTRNTNKRRKIIYTYFYNTQTGARSDSKMPAYLVIGSPDAQFVKDQMLSKEAVFSQILQELPAFPQWQTTEFEAPDRVVVHNGAVENDDNLIAIDDSSMAGLAVSN